MAVASATSDTILSADHSPVALDMAMAWRPKSRASPGSPGYSTGMCMSDRTPAEDDGIVEDLALGSSPTMATTPPRGAAPANTAWRRASVARSTPGALPYQTPITPS